MTPEAILDRLSGKQTEIENRPPANFTPVQIVYRRLGLDCKRNTFIYEVREKPTKKGEHTDFKDIKHFSLDMLGSKYSIKGHDSEENKPLDVNISRDAHIIFELPIGWSFLPNAVTLGGETPNTAAYGELRYVVKGNVSEKYLPNCRLVYFSANFQDMTNPYLQSFNFNVLMPNGLAILVDPDIRFPGNGLS